MSTQPSNESGRPAIRAIASDNAVRTAAWHVIPLLAVGYIVSYIDRANVGFAALTMNRDLGLSSTQFGFAAGTFYFGYSFSRFRATLRCGGSERAAGWHAS